MPEGATSEPEVKWHRKNRPVFLMASLFLLILVYPAFQARPFAGLALTGLLTIIFISSVLSVSRSPRLFLAVCLLGLPCIVLSWLTRFVDFGMAIKLLAAAWLITFELFIVLIMLVRVLTQKTVTANTLCRAVSAYLLIGIAWASLYQLLHHLDPAAFSPAMEGDAWGRLVYFSFTVLTTLGFGDITPASPFARSLVTVESVIGPMYLAILIARLVAMHRDRRYEGRT